MKAKFIVLLVILVLFLIFLFQNSRVVSLRFYFWEISMSQIIVIPLFLVVGFVLGYIVALLAGKNKGLLKRTHARIEKDA